MAGAWMTDVDALLPFDFIRVSPCRREALRGFRPWFNWRQARMSLRFGQYSRGIGEKDFFLRE